LGWERNGFCGFIALQERFGAIGSGLEVVEVGGLGVSEGGVGKCGEGDRQERGPCDAVVTLAADSGGLSGKWDAEVALHREQRGMIAHTEYVKTKAKTGMLRWDVSVTANGPATPPQWRDLELSTHSRWSTTIR
jgi:hypothetical protein